MTNSADPGQLASEEANSSGSTLFAKAGHIRQGLREPDILCRFSAILCKGDNFYGFLLVFLHFNNLYHSRSSWLIQQTTNWYFSYFSPKTGFDISCKFSPLETICIKWHNLFPEKKQNISICRLLKILPRILSVKQTVQKCRLIWTFTVCVCPRGRFSCGVDHLIANQYHTFTFNSPR